MSVKEFYLGIDGKATVENDDNSTKIVDLASSITFDSTTGLIPAGPGRDAVVEAAGPGVNNALQYLDDVFALAPEAHQPAISQATGDTTALSSPVVYRPYICGTGSQVTNSDGQGDSNIRFLSGTYNTANGGSADLAMYGSIKPGGDAQVARWPVIASFNT